MPDVRCRGKRHAVLIEPGILEVKCDSRVCGADTGVVILHRFNAETGELIATQRFSDIAVPTTDGKKVKWRSQRSHSRSASETSG